LLLPWSNIRANNKLVAHLPTIALAVVSGVSRMRWMKRRLDVLSFRKQALLWQQEKGFDAHSLLLLI